MLSTIFTLFPISVLFLADGFIQNTTAQGHLQRPDISVNPVIVFENDTVEVTCEAPVTGVRFALYKDTQDKPLSAENVSSDTYTFSVTDRELLQGESLNALYSNVQLSCDYTRKARSERSQKKTVTVYRPLKSAKLTAHPTVIKSSDSVQLDCESLSGSQCYFHIVEQSVSRTPSACQSSFTGSELLRGRSHNAESVVRVQCQYFMGNGEIKAPLSEAVTITVLGFTVNSTISPGTKHVVLSDAQTAEIRVNAVGVTEAGSISVTCSAPPRVVGSVWRLFRNTEDSPLMSQTSEGQQQHFSVSGTRLLQGVVKTGPIMEVEVSCDYTEKEKSTPSQRSEKKKVKVLGKLPQAELKRTPEVISMNDPVLLRCEGPESRLLSLCNFYIDRKELTENPRACNISLTGSELLRGRSHTVETEVKVECQYIVDIGFKAPSPHSANVTISVLDFTKPNISISENQSVTLIKCIAPPPITGCMFYLSFNNTETEKQAAAGERAVTFTVLQSFNSAQTYCCRYQYRTFNSDLQCTGAEENQGLTTFFTPTSPSPVTPGTDRIGIGVGVLLLVVLLLVVTTLCLIWIHKKRTSQRQPVTEKSETTYALVGMPNAGPSCTDTPIPEVVYSTVTSLSPSPSHPREEMPEDVTYSTIPS